MQICSEVYLGELYFISDRLLSGVSSDLGGALDLCMFSQIPFPLVLFINLTILH